MTDHIPTEPAVSPAHDPKVYLSPSVSIKSGASWNRVLQAKPWVNPIDTKNQLWITCAVLFTFVASIYVIWTFFAPTQIKRLDGTEQGPSTEP